MDVNTSPRLLTGGRGEQLPKILDGQAMHGGFAGGGPAVCGKTRRFTWAG